MILVVSESPVASDTLILVYLFYVCAYTYVYIHMCILFNIFSYPLLQNDKYKMSTIVNIVLVPLNTDLFIISGCMKVFYQLTITSGTVP